MLNITKKCMLIHYLIFNSISYHFVWNVFNVSCIIW